MSELENSESIGDSSDADQPQQAEADSRSISASAEPDAPQPEDSDGAMHRRAMMKKAAASAGVAAGVWVAPRIEGLTLRPDYAAAGTVRGNFSFVRNNPLQGNQSFNVPSPTGNETINASYAGDSTNGPINVSFAAMDPPFNSNCRVVAASGNSPGGVGNVRASASSPTSVSWDIYNPFWGNTNTASANQLTFNITC